MFCRHFFKPLCSISHYCATSFNKALTQVLRKFRSYSRPIGDPRWWGSSSEIIFQVPLEIKPNSFHWSSMTQKQSIIKCLIMAVFWRYEYSKMLVGSPVFAWIFLCKCSCQLKTVRITFSSVAYGNNIEAIFPWYVLQKLIEVKKVTKVYASRILN